MNDKRAILCLGAESTGTRIMCRQFNFAGFHGRGSGNYFDRGIPKDKKKIIWHRTYPMDGLNTKARTWVPVSKMVYSLRGAGFEDIRAVVTVRDWYSIIKSQVRVGHTSSSGQSWDNLQKAYLMIFAGLQKCQIPYVIVTYESWLLHGKPVLDHMFEMLDIDPPEEIKELKDGNKKYYS